MEEHGAELGAQDQTTLFVPGEGRFYRARLIDIAHIVGEGGQVMTGVGQLKNSLSDNLAGRLRAEVDGSETVKRDDGELLDDEEIQSLTFNFLARHKVQNRRVEIGCQ